MRDIRERIVGAVLAVVGIAAMVLAFGGGTAHAAPGLDQAVTSSMVQEETSSDSSDTSSPDSSDSSDTSDASDTSDTSDTTDEEQSDTPTPAPLPTQTPTTQDTPTELPTEDASGTTRRTSPLGWILLGGGVLMAGAAFAVYRRGV